MHNSLQAIASCMVSLQARAGESRKVTRPCMTGISVFYTSCSYGFSPAINAYQVFGFSCTGNESTLVDCLGTGGVCQADSVDHALAVECGVSEPCKLMNSVILAIFIGSALVLAVVVGEAQAVPLDYAVCPSQPSWYIDPVSKS